MASNAITWIQSTAKKIWPDRPITAHILVPQISCYCDTSLSTFNLGPSDVEIPLVGINLQHVSDRRSGTKFISWGLTGSHPKAYDLPVHALTFFKAKAIVPIVNQNDYPDALLEAKYLLEKCIWTEDIEVRRWTRERHWERGPQKSGTDSFMPILENAEYDVLGEDLVLKHLPILVLVNYKNMSDAADADEISKELNLFEHLEGRNWRVQPCCTSTGDGLQEGFNWLSNFVASPQKEMFKRMSKSFPETKQQEMTERK